MISDSLKYGPQNAAHRSLYHALGLTKEEIDVYEKKNLEHPELREAHKRLAQEIITDLHGADEYEKASRSADRLWGEHRLDALRK